MVGNFAVGCSCELAFQFLVIGPYVLQPAKLNRCEAGGSWMAETHQPMLRTPAGNPAELFLHPTRGKQYPAVCYLDLGCRVAITQGQSLGSRFYKLRIETASAEFLDHIRPVYLQYIPVCEQSQVLRPAVDSLQAPGLTLKPNVCRSVSFHKDCSGACASHSSLPASHAAVTCRTARMLSKAGLGCSLPPSAPRVCLPWVLPTSCHLSRSTRACSSCLSETSKSARGRAQQQQPYQSSWSPWGSEPYVHCQAHPGTRERSQRTGCARFCSSRATDLYSLGPLPRPSPVRLVPPSGTRGFRRSHCMVRSHQLQRSLV